jgi:hypothetical protein
MGGMSTKVHGCRVQGRGARGARVEAHGQQRQRERRSQATPQGKENVGCKRRRAEDCAPYQRKTDHVNPKQVQQLAQLRLFAP